ncbi:unnamed protein product [Caenorhabditis auriculariae]|uniref:Uncharacterized protein n=1 Tax=Caenorhabditis auriculariae TaxID=2777116 RepID=A0A8S1HKH8_9PELO|nr:unnamed protein product [Caenorhabditis auriculariae]
MLRFVVFLCLSSSVLAGLGLDAVQYIAPKTFQCLAGNGFSFFAGRLWQRYNYVDNNGVLNIANARSAGFKEIYGYIYPCISSDCPPPEGQVQAVLRALKANGASCDKIFIDVEQPGWPSNSTFNQDFITRMGSELDYQGAAWGIYTNEDNWKAVTGGKWTKMKNQPLWWAEPNNNQDFNGYYPFGGWRMPYMHQYQTDSSSCGVSLDRIWHP